MKVDIEYLEKLSKLKLNEQEKAKIQADIEATLDFVDSITKLDLPEEDKNRTVALEDLRPDELIDKEQCDLLGNAPKKKDGCYVTPLVVE